MLSPRGLGGASSCKNAGDLSAFACLARYSGVASAGMKRLMGLAVAAVLLTGCGGSGGEATPQASDDGVTKADLEICVAALDEANAGFNKLAEQVQTVQEALRAAFAGDVQGAQAMLSTVEGASPTRYKELEAECRAKAS